ncbi:MAG: rhomboid family intramembrane serine protease [Acidobacteria bacterium]|nr:rhomboid family intramembrane serine protease [Acidobacteriota bacterium]
MGPAVKWLILTNVVTFVLTAFIIALLPLFGLLPVAVIEHYRVWQLVTYMFLHAGLFHIIFNMLALWMFGVELERLWGARQFLTYYFVAGAGAAFVTVAVSLLPFDFSSRIYFAETIGASGAIYGVLLAYGLRFPDRPIYMYLLFPIPAKYFVLILGAISFFVSVTDPRSGVAHATHLGGLVVGYLYLKGGGGGLTAEIKYRYLKWKMNRLRRKFDVYSGGRNDWNRHQH